MVVDCGELEELGEVVAGGEHQHWQDVTDESTLVIMMTIMMTMTAKMVMRMGIGTMTLMMMNYY